MVTISKFSSGLALQPRARAGHVVANPARRGPVVLATDGKGRSGATVVAAQLLAARLDVPLQVISVLEPTPVIAAVPDVIIPSDPAIDDARCEAREMAVRDFVGRFAGGATPPRVHVRLGGVVGEVTRFAREVSASIIVVGSAPHRRFRHVASGDLAARMLHAAVCPVLSVPPTFAALPRVVLAAVDFGPSSVRAAQAALLIVNDRGTVILTHVLSPLTAAEPTSTEPDAPAADVHALFDRLREELAPLTPRGVTVETRLITGDAVEEVLASADHLDVDAIALGTHGQGLLGRWLLGSVAETVLHHAQRPVLVAPPPTPPESLELARRVTGVATSSREQEWATALDAFTRRNLGRSVMLEVDDPENGAHVAGHGYSLVGVTYEPKANRVEIMLGDANRPRRHLTRSVMHPDAITMTAAVTGGGEVLDIRHGRGHTLAVVSDAAIGSVT